MHCSSSNQNLPASAPANADNKSPKVPTPTTSGSTSKFELLTKPAILPAAKSKTRNFITAKGSSRDTIGLKEDQSGVISSNCSPGVIADGDDADATGIPLFSRF